MSSTEFTAEESLQTIQEMIAKAKQSFTDVSFYYLLWGWVMLAASLGEWLLREFVQFDFPWITWPIASALGGIISGVYGSKHQSKSLPTYMDRLQKYVWGGYGILLFLTIFLCISQSLNPSPFVLILTGLPTFISGGMSKFKPLILGGVAFWVLGAISFFSPTFYVPLIFSLGMMAGYLIPGYMLKGRTANG